MRSFLLGILLGVCFDGTVTLLAKEYLNQSPRQQQYDYFCERQQQLGMEHIRKQLDQGQVETKTRRAPC